MNSYFSIGTTVIEKQTEAARVVANAVKWLISKQNEDGTWGASQELDRFITTNHVVMTLLSIGVPSDSKLLSRAFDYLNKLTDNEMLTFFWRAGTFLNISRYNGTVSSDMEYIWENCRRGTGTHKDYPAPFFLLKLLRFSKEKLTLSFTQEEVLAWVLEDWKDDKCWYDRTSIASMALALIYDLDFTNNESIIKITKAYIKNHFHFDNGVASFSDQILDDSYLVFNLCENGYLLQADNADLLDLISNIATSILGQVREDTYWTGKPPFGGGGQIGEYIYPTAVIVRALLSFYCLLDPTFLNEVAAHLVESSLVESPKHTVFISYSSKETDLADIVDEKLKKVNGIKVTRYTRDVDYRENFKDFMKRVKKHDFVVMLISDSFIKSQACMFEVGEVLTDEGFKKKLLFIVVSDSDKQYIITPPKRPIGAKIYSPTDRSKYVLYWQNQYKRLKASIDLIESSEAKIELSKPLREIRRIIDHDLSPFLEYVSECRGLSFDAAYNSEFSDLLSVIECSEK